MPIPKRALGEDSERADGLVAVGDPGPQRGPIIPMAARQQSKHNLSRVTCRVWANECTHSLPPQGSLFLEPSEVLTLSTTGTPGEVSASGRPGCAAELLRALAIHPRLGTMVAVLPAAALETAAAAQVAKAWELVHAMDYDQLGPLLAHLIGALDGSSAAERLTGSIV